MIREHGRLNMDELAVEVLRNPSHILENGVWHGIYEVEHYRRGKLLHKSQSHNAITTEGKRYIVDIVMKGATDVYTLHTNSWFVCLAGNGAGGAAPTSAPTPNLTQTYVSKQGSSTFCEFQDYGNLDNGGGSGAYRPIWNGTMDGALASITSNAAKASITVAPASLNTGTIFGAALVTRETKGDSTSGNYLLSYSNFTSSITVVHDDVVKVGVTVSLS